MMRTFLHLLRDRAGSAAAEMILVVPFLLALMFGAFEMGYFYSSEHVVQKGVRDAARYAARLPLSNYDCTALTVNATAQAQIQKVARTGLPDGTVSRLDGWTSDGMTAVTLACKSDTTLTYVNKGIYKDFPGGVVPVVSVDAAVPYPTLFGKIGIGSATNARCGAGQPASAACLQLNASSQSAVFGA